MGFIALIRRELANAFFHDARRAIFLFGAATAYLILFGILYYPGVVKEIPTVVCDEEHTAYSRLLTRQVDDDERLGLVRVVADEGEARDMLRRKEVYAAVIIPADFLTISSTAAALKSCSCSTGPISLRPISPRRLATTSSIPSIRALPPDRRPCGPVVMNRC